MAATPMLASSGLWLPAGLPQAYAQSNGALAPAPPRLDVFELAADSLNLFHRWYDNSTGWSDWELLATSLFVADMTSWGPGRVDIVAIPDNGGHVGTVQHRWYDNGWSNWEDLGLPSSGAPNHLQITSWGPGHLDVFGWEGERVNMENILQNYVGVMVHKSFDNGQWSAEQHLGGSFGFDLGISAVSRGAGGWDVFAVGWDANRDPEIFWMESNQGSLSGWFPLVAPTIPTSSPVRKGLTGGLVVASWGPSRLDLFANGETVTENPDHNPWHRWLDSNNGSWSDWENLGKPSGGGTAPFVSQAVSWSNPNAGTPPPILTPQVQGTYSGSLTVGSVNHNMTMQFTQSGTTFTGTATISGAWNSAFTLTGTLTGDGGLTMQATNTDGLEITFFGGIHGLGHLSGIASGLNANGSWSVNQS